MLDDAQLVKHFPNLLQALRARIKALPPSLPVAIADGPLHRYFGDLEVDDEGAAYTINRQWERAFQVTEVELRKRLGRGKYGMDLVCPFLDFYAEQDGIKGTDRVGMLARRIHNLNTILDSIPAAMPAVPASQFFTPRPAKNSAVIPAKRHAVTDPDDDPKDISYHPPRDDPVLSEEDTDAVEEVEPPTATRKGKEKGMEKGKGGKSKEPAKKLPTKRQKTKQSAEDSDNESEPPLNEADVPVTKAGRNPTKGRWAISNYISPPTVHKNAKSNPVWRWECKWCKIYRASPRTTGCTRYEDEKIELVVDSNFHSHLAACKGIPEDASFEVWTANELAEKAGTRPVPIASSSVSVSPRSAQRDGVRQSQPGLRGWSITRVLR
ncbi:hypothetical protein C8R47DRAFT_1316289 [Mycena vitilis]|nr:hypothetical protein C8R47DRAFT_1316289 [Mycena vitilis]